MKRTTATAVSAAKHGKSYIYIYRLIARANSLYKRANRVLHRAESISCICVHMFERMLLLLLFPLKYAVLQLNVFVPKSIRRIRTWCLLPLYMCVLLLLLLLCVPTCSMFMCACSIWLLLYAKLPIRHSCVLRFSLKYLKIHFVYTWIFKKFTTTSIN